MSVWSRLQLTEGPVYTLWLLPLIAFLLSQANFVPYSTSNSSTPEQSGPYSAPAIEISNYLDLIALFNIELDFAWRHKSSTIAPAVGANVER